MLHFGKYKGIEYSEVPQDYLEWALKTVESLSDTQKNDIRTILGKPKEFVEDKLNKEITRLKEEKYGLQK